MFNIFKNKMYWLYLCLIAVVVMIFSLALVGARSTVKVQQVPVAVVDLDHSTASQQIVKQLKHQFKADDATLKLTSVSRQKQLTTDFNYKKYYGAIVIKKDFGQKLASQTQYLQALAIAKATSASTTAAIMTQQAEIEFKVNAGANATVTSLLTSAFSKMGQTLSGKVSQQEVSALAQNDLSVSASQLSFLNSPIKTSVKTVHPIKDKTVSGMLPMLITAISWITGLITSILVWYETKKVLKQGRLTAKSITGQILGGGLATVLVAVIFYVLGLGLNLYLPDFWMFVGTFVGITFIFYLIQACVLDWLGMKGWPLLILVWLFGMGTMTYIPQMLNVFYRVGVYSWIPMRFALDIYNNMLYYANVASTSAQSWLVLTCIGLGALVLLYLSSLKKAKQ